MPVDGQGEAVRLVDHRQVPVALSSGERLAHSLGAQEVAADDHPVEYVPRVLGRVGVEHRRVHLLEAQLEALAQLARPLRTQAGRGHDEDPVADVAQLELLHVEAGHDRLACAGVVGEQEPQSRLAQELAVHRLELVRQRLDVGHCDRRHVVGERSLDPARLNSEAKPDRIAIEWER